MSPYLGEHVDFFPTPNELSLLGTGAQPILDALAKKGPDAKTRPMY